MSKKQVIVILVLGWFLYLSAFVGFTFFINQLANGKLGELPSFEELENPQSYLATEVYSSDEVLLGKYYLENRSNVDFEHISPHLINALVATEDIRYYKHSGIDMRGLLRAVLNLGKSGGASTITQQLAKNLFHDTRNKSLWERVKQKLLEQVIAVKLEKSYTKEEIITMYFNTVPFGENSFGIKAASKTFFNTTPDSLQIEEAAVLVGMLKANTLYNPRRNPEISKTRRNTVLSQMVKYQFARASLVDTIKENSIVLNYHQADHNEGIAPYFRKILRLQMNQWCRENKKVDGSNYNLYKDGLKIYTTIDSRMQQYAEEAVREHLTELQDIFFEHWEGKNPWHEIPNVLDRIIQTSHRYQSLKKLGLAKDSIIAIMKKPVKMTLFSWKGNIDTSLSPIDSIKYYRMFIHTGMLAVDPKTGHVKVWVGGINHQHFKYDHVNTRAKRQVGSTFKPFVYAVAVDNGVSPCKQYPNARVTFENYDNWTADNASSKNYGQMKTMMWGLANSINTITAGVMKDYGPENGENVIRLAKNIGITSDIPSVPSICLGVTDISVYEMAGAYSTFANKGYKTTPIYIDKIIDKNGNVLFKNTINRKQVLSEETSYIMNKMLQHVVNKGTAIGLRLRHDLYNEIAGKTGTTQNGSDGWFMGIVPNLVTAVWTGCDDRGLHFRTLQYGQGGKMALPIWANFIKKVYENPKLGITMEDKFEKPYGFKQELDCDRLDKEENKQSSKNSGYGNEWD